MGNDVALVGTVAARRQALRAPCASSPDGGHRIDYKGFVAGEEPQQEQAEDEDQDEVLYF